MPIVCSKCNKSLTVKKIHFKDSSMHPASIQALFPHDSQKGRLCKEALHGIDCS